MCFECTGTQMRALLALAASQSPEQSSRQCWVSGALLSQAVGNGSSTHLFSLKKRQFNCWNVLLWRKVSELASGSERWGRKPFFRDARAPPSLNIPYHLHSWKLQSSTAKNFNLLNLNNHWRETAVIESRIAARKMKTFKKRSPRSRKTALVGSMLQRPALPCMVLAIQLKAFTGLVADCLTHTFSPQPHNIWIRIQNIQDSSVAQRAS